ncbi:hypothetical protein JCM8208_002590 [Rhodotorula glutinis]
MANAFVGLPVLIRLKGNTSAFVTGVLSSLDPVAGSLTLTEARSSVGGQERLEGIRILSRSEVAGLELLSVGRTESPAAAPRHASSQPAHPVQQRQPTYASAHSPVPSPAPSPSPLTGSPRPAKQRQRGQRGGRRIQNLKEPLESEDGDESDLSRVSNEPRRPKQQAQSSGLNEDFDFGAGLASFNKHEVFEQIRSNDDTDPALRLVAHNRNPSARQASQVKLLPTESVLSPSELVAQQAERRDVHAQVRRQAAVREPEGLGAGGKGEERSAEERLVETQRQMAEMAVEGESGAAQDGPVTRLVTRLGVEVPTVSTRQWKEAVSIAEIESFPTSVQRLEAASHALTTYILTHLSLRLSLLPPPPSPASSSSSTKPTRPFITLLCSADSKGLIALRAGTTLANRGCRIVALVEDGGEGTSAGVEQWRTAVRVLSSAGGRIVRDVQDLPASAHLLIDALSTSPTSLDGERAPSSAMTSPRLDSTAAFSSLGGGNSAFAPSAAAWARQQQGKERAPVLLSIDVPHGVDPDSGAPLDPSLAPLTPSHLLALGLPRTALLHLGSSRPSLALADIGFPPALWARVGVVDEVDEVRGLWGVEGVVELERR